MSVPPDKFDENGEPIEPEQPEELPGDNFIAWYGEGNAPDWFYRDPIPQIITEVESYPPGSVSMAVDLFGLSLLPAQLSDRERVARNPLTGNYTIFIDGFEEDTYTDLGPWQLTDFSRQDLIDFSDYMITIYGVYWNPDYPMRALPE